MSRVVYFLITEVGHFLIDIYTTYLPCRGGVRRLTSSHRRYAPLFKSLSDSGMKSQPESPKDFKDCGKLGIPLCR